LAQWLRPERRVDQSERYLDWILRPAREARASISEGGTRVEALDDDQYMDDGIGGLGGAGW